MKEETTHGRQRIHAGCWVDWDRKGVWHHQTFRPLPPHAFRILSYLVDHHDQVIPNRTLITVGWPGEIGHESSDLYGQIYLIRVAVEAHPMTPRWLENHYGYGYLLHIPGHPISSHSPAS